MTSRMQRDLGGAIGAIVAVPRPKGSAMSANNDLLAEAVDEAMRPVLAEMAGDVVCAAITGVELPAHPELLVEALHEAHDALEDLWERLCGSTERFVVSRDRTELDEARCRVEIMTVAANRIIDQIEEVRGWLIVVVSRLCLDQLRSARSRHEELDGRDAEPPGPGVDPALFGPT